MHFLILGWLIRIEKLELGGSVTQPQNLVPGTQYLAFLSPRDHAPFGQPQESRPLVRSKTEVCNSWTSHHSAHAQSQV